MTKLTFAQEVLDCTSEKDRAAILDLFRLTLENLESEKQVFTFVAPTNSVLINVKQNDEGQWVGTLLHRVRRKMN